MLNARDPRSRTWDADRAFTTCFKNEEGDDDDGEEIESSGDEESDSGDDKDDEIDDALPTNGIDYTQLYFSGAVSFEFDINDSSDEEWVE